MQTIEEKPLEKMDILRPFRIGDIVEGQVIGIGRSSVYLNLGPQGTGVIFGREFKEEKEHLLFRCDISCAACARCEWLR